MGTGCVAGIPGKAIQGHECLRVVQGMTSTRNHIGITIKQNRLQSFTMLSSMSLTEENMSFYEQFLFFGFGFFFVFMWVFVGNTAYLKDLFFLSFFSCILTYIRSFV